MGIQLLWQGVLVDVPDSLTLDDTELMVQSASNGLGIAYIRETFGRDMLASGQLVAVLVEWRTPLSGLMLYYPGRRHIPSALRALVDVLKEANRRIES